ncbi:MAG: DNA methylase, partial [Anaerolineales bacterium]|nr:DNA methylase [Anaerolineales bacterium]
SELNFLWEAWLRVFTNNEPEAIVNKVQRKGLPEYQRLMEQCFREFYCALKPGHWMTVEFHNSQNRVWNAIQEAVLRAGFMIADVRTLDKKQGTFKQMTTTAAVKQDLIISAYKPRTGFERRFLEKAGTPEGAWEFVRQHLAQLPIVVERDGSLEVVAERQAYLLFDRMVAFHIQRGATVPLSAAEFYAGLRERFVERDGMFFLPDQVPEYDRARLQAAEVAQLTLFVSDEKSSIQWLRQQMDSSIGGYPQTYQEIQPQFLRQLHQARHEVLPELSEILEQSFLQDAAGRWYVPDPNRASDLEKLRQRALLREFAEYVEGRGRLRQFRTEAVRAGFADAWRRRDYATIVNVAERLPERVLQEDPDLLMYYDNATLRVE